MAAMRNFLSSIDNPELRKVLKDIITCEELKYLDTEPEDTTERLTGSRDSTASLEAGYQAFKKILMEAKAKSTRNWDGTLI
jgi:hypothetical protein